ncbi:MAG: FtsX-like permease family protein [Candidatus Palauibacterales bacterium]|jgi:putative ABC transport system permease protein|nr:FtsX-like permease family protein [Candidatus Palauibacterales bacterium]
MSSRRRIRLRLALRNLSRQKRRSALSGSAMLLAMALLVFSRAIADGGHEEWIDAGVRMGDGHVSVQAPEYRTRRSLEYRLSPDVRAAVQDALRAPAISNRVVASAPRLTVQGLASSSQAALPVAVMGVDPELERSFSRLDEKLEEGRWLKPDDRLQAYVGARLASRLKLKEGSRFVLTAQDASGEITGQMVRVAGTFRSGIPEMDEGLLQIPLATAQEWLGVPGSVTSEAILLRDSRDTRPALRDLRSALAGWSDDAAVLGWRESMPELNAALRMDDWADYVFHLVLFVIAATAIVNTILMSVMYRTREFGVLRALGLERGEVGRVVFIEGMILTAISGVVGMALGAAVVWGFFRNGLDFSALWDMELEAAGVVIDPVIIPAFHWNQILLSLISILAIGSLSSVYPAWRATRIDVAEAMKFEE